MSTSRGPRGGQLWLSHGALEVISWCGLNSRDAGTEVGGLLKGEQLPGSRFVVAEADNRTVESAPHRLRMLLPDGFSRELGIWHTHLHAAAEPSSIDVRGAAALAYFMTGRR